MLKSKEFFVRPEKVIADIIRNKLYHVKLVKPANSLQSLCFAQPATLKLC